MRMQPDARPAASGPLTVVDLLATQASNRRDQPAFTFLENGDQESDLRTYGDLDQRARALATRLREICEPGERALLLFKPSLDFLSAFFGCLYAGVVPVPAYP